MSTEQANSGQTESNQTSADTSSATNIAQSDAANQGVQNQGANQGQGGSNQGGQTANQGAKKDDGQDLMFGARDKKDTSQDQNAKPTPAQQREFLLSKASDDAAKKALEGKTDEEISKMFDDAKAKDGGDNAPQFDVKELLTNLPENIEVTPENQQWLGDYAKANNLTKEQTQALVNKGVEMQQKTLDMWAETKSGWREEVKADKTFGGQNLQKSVGAAENLVARFGSTATDPKVKAEEMMQMQEDLQLLGLGNKLSFIRFCNNIAKAIGEDKMEGSSGLPNKDQKDLATRMWPNMPGDTKA